MVRVSIQATKSQAKARGEKLDRRRQKKEFFEKIYIRQKSSTRSENEKSFLGRTKRTVKFV